MKNIQENIKDLITFIKGIRDDLICFVDNCYGEFIDTLEPTEVGADLMAGSLIKNPGGGIAPTGGYIAGKNKYVENASNALLQKKYVMDHVTKNLVRNKGELPRYYVQNTHLPIIDEATFQKAQEVMAENRERSAGKNDAKSYPFTGKIVCGRCGKNYKRKTRQGRITWNCSTYLKYGKDSCPAKQIPENILTSESAEVLGLSEFDEVEFKRLIKEIQVPESNLLVFMFHDGHCIRREWSYKPRSESWSEEDRLRAREIQLKGLERRDLLCAQQGQ